MASLPPSLRETLAYFDKYDYPLTLDEIRFWQGRVTPFASSRAKGVTLFSRKGKYYFLPGRSHLVKLRHQREKFSKTKWVIAREVGKKLEKFSSIEAVFVTGALAMNNCPQDDDIDIMIVTHPNTLWITRFFVNLYLWRLRRFPGQTSAPNKICPNLWLDTRNLKLEIRNLYIAHEILQAKPLWNRAHIHAQFLRSNSWASKYLPVAYKHLTLGPSPKFRRGKAGSQGEVFWKLLNLLFFLPQYLYMLPKMTSERVSLHSAFFHPRLNP